MRAVLWGRASDLRRRKDEAADAYTERVHQDVDNQIRPLLETAGRLGWELVRDPFRVERTAWSSEPPEKEELFEILKGGRVDVLAVWSLDRWTRQEPVAALTEIVRLERHYGVAFYSLQEPFLSTATGDPGLRQALVALMAWLGESESRKKSERVRAAVAMKRARTGNLGQNPKWGRGRIPSDKEKDAILELRAEDPEAWSYSRLADASGFSKSTVARIVRAAERPGDGP